MGRYSTPGLFFFSPSNLTAALQSGASRPMESVRATSRLGEIGTFEATYAYPLNHGSGYVAFGLLEAVGNIAIIIYSDFNYPPGVQRSKMVGECYIIDNVKVEDRQAGGLQVRISGRSFLAELENKQVWEPIGDSTTYSTTLAVAVGGPSSSNSVGETAAGETEIVVVNASNFFDTNMVLIPLTGGGTYIGLVSSVDYDTNTITLDRPLPATIPNATSVTRRGRRLFVNNTEGFEVGAKVTITLNSGSFTTIVEDGVTMEDVSGTEMPRVLLRDGVTGAANVGNAAVAINKSKPTTTPYDDIAQVIAHAPGWTSDNTLMPPTPGTSHVPDGASVFDLLKTIADIQDTPFRQEVDPSNLRPVRKIKWGIYPSADAYGGVKIILENPPPSMMAQHLSKAHRGTIHGTISREYRDNKVTRLYPTGGDAGVTLMGVSTAVRSALAGMGFVIVDDPATLGLYEPPYMYNNALEPGEKIARRVTFGDITAETSGSTTWMYACDRLAWQSARWLMSRTRAYWEWRITDVDVSSPVIPRVGTTFDLTRYLDPQMDKTAFPATYTWENVENLIAREITVRWDVKRQIPIYDFVLSDVPGDPTDSAPALVSQFQTYDMVARRVGQGRTDRASTIAYTAPPPPGDGGGVGVFLPLAGGTMTGNIGFSGAQTVDGVDISAHAANASAHHAPVTAGNASINVSGQAINVKLTSEAGLEVDGGFGLRIKRPTDSGIALLSTGAFLVPGTLTAATGNTLSGTSHTHAVTASDNTVSAGAASLLKSTSTGGLSLDKLGVGITGEAAAALTVKSKATTNYTVWLKQLSGQTHDMWRVDDSAGNPLIRLTGGGDLESGTPGFVSGMTGWEIKANGSAEFNDVRVRGELHATTFVADEMHAVGGTLLVKTAGKVSYSSNPARNKLPAALNSTFWLDAEASWDTGLNYFPVGSILRIKPMGEVASGGNLDLWDIYLEVKTVSDDDGAPWARDLANGKPGVYALECYWRHGGAANIYIPAGSAIVKWTETGASGYTGALKLTGDGDGDYAPFIDVFTVDKKASGTWSGTPPVLKPRVRVGNLRGVLGKSADEWGMAAGTDLSSDSTSAQYIVASDTSGVMLKNVGIKIYSGADQTVDITSAGYFRLGTNTTNVTTRTLSFDPTDGSLILGGLDTNKPNLFWDATGGTLALRVNTEPVITLSSSGNSEFTGTMKIGASGGIWQGTGGSPSTFANPYNGLKIWNQFGAGRIGFWHDGERRITLRYDRGMEIANDGGRDTAAAVVFTDIPSGTIRGGLYGFQSDSAVDILLESTYGAHTSSILLTGGTSKRSLELTGGTTSLILSSVSDFALLTGADLYVRERGVAVGYTTTPTLNRGVIASDLAGAHDNPSLVLQDTTDVAHGMTSIASTGTFGNVRKSSNSAGGLKVSGYSELVESLTLEGNGGTSSDTKATTSLGAVVIRARLKSGTDAGALGTNGNLMVIRNHDTTRFIFDAEGDFHADSGSTTFDEFDDVRLTRAADLALGGHDIDAEYNRWLTYNRDDLARLGLVSKDGFVNMTRMQRLLTGAIWQLSERINRLEEKLA